MFKKIYEKVKKYIIKNHNYLLFLIFLILVLNIKTPYVVKAPGGTLSLNKRIKINNKKIKSKYYTSYVTVLDGKVASLIAGFIMPNWDIVKYKDYSNNSSLTYDELNKSEHLSMKKGNNDAIIAAFDNANIKYSLSDSKVYVLYKYEEFDNKLKIGDQIIKCNNLKISNYDDLNMCTSNAKNNSVDLTVLRNNKEKNIKASLYDYDGKKIIGVYIFIDYKINSDYKIDIGASKNESGSSGGFMTALCLYDEITGQKLSKGRKIAGTGTIDVNGNVGKISAIKYKLIGANKDKVDVFFVPSDNYKEAKKVKNKYHLKLNIVKVKTLNDAINYLNSLN